MSTAQRLIAMVAVLAAAGAFIWFYTFAPKSDPAVVSCEEFTVAQLLAPSTYRLVDSDVGDGEVSIEYDAQNAFGARIRSTSVCNYDYYAGVFHFAVPRADVFSNDPLAALRASYEITTPTFERRSTQLEPSLGDWILDKCLAVLRRDTRWTGQPSWQEFDQSAGVTFAPDWRSVRIMWPIADGALPREMECTSTLTVAPTVTVLAE